MDKGPMDNKTVVEYQAKPEDIVEIGVESQNNANSEKGISKGEERYNQISQSISSAKDKFSGWVSGGTAKLGRLFKTGAVGILSTPEVVASGIKTVGDAYNKAENWVDTKDAQVSQKVQNVGKKIGYKAASLYESGSNWMKDKKDRFANWREDKKEKATAYLKDKALTVEAVGSLMKDKTKEKLNSAKEGIKNNYNKVTEYGQNAIDTAKLRAWYAQDAYNAKMNNIKKSILERKASIQAEKLQGTLMKLSQYKKVEEIGNLMAA